MVGRALLLHQRAILESVGTERSENGVGIHASQSRPDLRSLAPVHIWELPGRLVQYDPRSYTR
jgi:hypothetical protein